MHPKGSRSRQNQNELVVIKRLLSCKEAVQFAQELASSPSFVKRLPPSFVSSTFDNSFTFNIGENAGRLDDKRQEVKFVTTPPVTMTNYLICGELGGKNTRGKLCSHFPGVDDHGNQTMCILHREVKITNRLKEKKVEVKPSRSFFTAKRKALLSSTAKGGNKGAGNGAGKSFSGVKGIMTNNNNKSLGDKMYDLDSMSQQEFDNFIKQFQENMTKAMSSGKSLEPFKQTFKTVDIGSTSVSTSTSSHKRSHSSSDDNDATTSTSDQVIKKVK
jgi:hypothetical protein